MSEPYNTPPTNKASAAGLARKYNTEQKKQCINHVRDNILNRFPRQDLEMKELKEELTLVLMRNIDKCRQLAELNQGNIRLNDEIYRNMREIENLQLDILDMVMDAEDDLHNGFIVIPEEEKDASNLEVGDILTDSMKMPISYSFEVRNIESQENKPKQLNLKQASSKSVAVNPNEEERKEAQKKLNPEAEHKKVQVQSPEDKVNRQSQRPLPTG